MKVLLIVEAVTLAHVGRSLALAQAMHASGVSLHFALGGAQKTPPTPWPQHALPGIGREAFADALRTGAPVLNLATLRTMITADFELLQKLSPDLVAGDFRLSLSVSARLAGIPYATLTNAYWSTACTLPLKIPVLPLSRMLPLPLASVLFDIGKFIVLPMHCRPVNQARREHGLASLGTNLRTVYTDADHVLFADVPGMFPMRCEPPHHHYLGAILWSPEVALPPWWSEVDRHRPLVYVTMGSSGDPRVLRSIVTTLASLPLMLVVSTAGSPALDDLSFSNVRHAPYLPGDQVASRASLVICNGGSMGCQQALVAEVPVLGVTGNMDQFLNMAGVVASGAGLQMRADRVRASELKETVSRLLEEPNFRNSASVLGSRIRSFDPGQRLVELLPRLAGGSASDT